MDALRRKVLIALLVSAVAICRTHGECDEATARTCLASLAWLGGDGDLTKLTSAEMKEVCDETKDMLACSNYYLRDCTNPDPYTVDFRDSIQDIYDQACPGLVGTSKACNTDAAQTCLNSWSQYENFDFNSASDDDRKNACSTTKATLDCTREHLDDCTNPPSDLTTKRDTAQTLYNDHCGAAQYLLSLPLYLAVLVISLKQLSGSL